MTVWNKKSIMTPISAAILILATKQVFALTLSPEIVISNGITRYTVNTVDLIASHHVNATSNIEMANNPAVHINDAGGHNLVQIYQGS